MQRHIAAHRQSTEVIAHFASQIVSKLVHHIYWM
jgi:hypothetical protein